MSSAPPNDPASTQQNIATGAFMPLESLKKRWKLGAALSLAVLLIGLPIAWSKGKPVYSVSAVIYVAPRFVNILQEGSGQELGSFQQYRQYVEQQARTVARYDILIEALQRMGERRSVWQLPGESERRAAERLQNALQVKAVKDSYLITVALNGSTSDGLDEVVNTVVTTFLDKVRQEDLFYAADQRIANLTTQKQRLSTSIAEQEKRRLEIAQELGVTTFVENAVNPFDQLLADSRIALADAQRSRVAAEARADAFDVNRNKEARTALDAATSELVGKDGGLFTLKANLHQRKIKLLEQFTGLSPGHPLYPQVKNELADIDTELASETAKVTSTIRSMLLEQRFSDARLARQIERQLTEQFDQQRQKAAWFAERYNEAILLTNGVERDRDQLKGIDKRLSYFELESNAPGFIRLDTPARPPEFPVGGGKKKPLMMVVIAALALGLIAPIGVDLLDRRIKTPGQVHKLLGYPPLAALLKKSEDIASRRVAADQLRRLALALDRERLQGGGLFLLTSVKPGAGVTTLALDLSVEFGQLGQRVLVIEANPLKPDARYRADGLRDGLLDLLIGDATIEQAIQPADGQLPDRIAIGLPVEPHLYAYHRLREILDELKARYPVVLIDAPPVLLSADVEFLAGVADATLLLIGAMQVQPGELKRAARVLEKADPRLISFIVTQLEPIGLGGYYGQMIEEYRQAEDAALSLLHRQDPQPTERST
ncbi:MAG: chain length determinant protein [Methylotetracoccus sp.]